jgi:hypothetical protein
MTATAVPVPTTTDEATETRSPSLWRAGLRSGLVAGAATSVVAAVALAAGVPLEIAGEQIPVLGFAQLTLMSTVLGVLLAAALRRWARQPERTFVVAALALTGLSFVPDVTADATTATKLVLIATHVVAASIVIPALARRLADA